MVYPVGSPYLEPCPATSSDVSLEDTLNNWKCTGQFLLCFDIQIFAGIWKFMEIQSLSGVRVVKSFHKNRFSFKMNIVVVNVLN